MKKIMAEIVPKIQEFRADGEVIRANIRRLWGTFDKAIEATGIWRQHWYDCINEGEIKDLVIARLWKLGINPAELVRPIEEKRA
jgi:hypothetical protein